MDYPAWLVGFGDVCPQGLRVVWLSVVNGGPTRETAATNFQW